VIPNKAFQALACGVPLVTADTPAARELIDDQTAVLVPPGDPEALAGALRRLANDRELAARLAAAGHAVYRERASEEALGRRWRAIFEEVA
jgi:glycosyltransferase involved in cell wall biosynthesis